MLAPITNTLRLLLNAVSLLISRNVNQKPPASNKPTNISAATGATIMMFRIVAGLSFQSMNFDKVLEPIGSPDVIYARIIIRRISRGLSSS